MRLEGGWQTVSGRLLSVANVGVAVGGVSLRIRRVGPWKGGGSSTNAKGECSAQPQAHFHVRLHSSGWCITTDIGGHSLYKKKLHPALDFLVAWFLCFSRRRN